MIGFEELPEHNKFIPPCIVRMRLADRRSALNNDPSYDGVTFGNAGDGDAYFDCSGNDYGCEGGRVKVDRHDISQTRMPEATIALSGICTSTQMHYSDNGFVRAMEVDHSR